MSSKKQITQVKKTSKSIVKFDDDAIDLQKNCNPGPNVKFKKK